MSFYLPNPQHSERKFQSLQKFSKRSRLLRRLRREGNSLTICSNFISDEPHVPPKNQILLPFNPQTLTSTSLQIFSQVTQLRHSPEREEGYSTPHLINHHPNNLIHTSHIRSSFVQRSPFFRTARNALSLSRPCAQWYIIYPIPTSQISICKCSKRTP